MFQIKPLVHSPLPVKALDARSFYLELHNNQDSQNFGRFIGEVRSMYTQGVDFVQLLTSEEQKLSTPNRKDYAITLEVAKNMALLSRTPNGKAYRKYLIDFEVKNAQPARPMTMLELIDQQREMELERLRQVAKFDNLQSEFLKVMEEDGFYQFITVAKLLGKPNLGRTKLMKLLRDKGVLLQSNLPAQAQLENGRFVVKRYYLKEVKKHCTTTLVTEKGYVFLAQLLVDYEQPTLPPPPPPPTPMLVITHPITDRTLWVGWTDQGIVDAKHGYWK